MVLLLASPIVLVVVLVLRLFPGGRSEAPGGLLSFHIFLLCPRFASTTNWPDDEDDDEGRGRFENLKWTERNSPN